MAIEPEDATTLSDMSCFSDKAIGRPLRPYQLAPSRAILTSVWRQRGDSITVMMSRQAGKNELSAQLECCLMYINADIGGNIVKCAPTFKPQAINSNMRLRRALQNPWTAREWKSEWSYIIRLGQARCFFFSANKSANVVGATADILLEFDEAQDISIEKHDRDFAPMGATTNCTRVYYGTAWDDHTLLEHVRRANEELETRDGITRNFSYPWWKVAEYNPLYALYVEGERDRLGDSHPLFRTQYMLETIGGETGFLTSQQRAQMQGDHPRAHRREDNAVYVAGVDIAGKDEEAADAILRSARPRKDSTVITIGRLDFSLVSDLILEPRICVLDHFCCTGHGHREQYQRILDILRSEWGCALVVVDATGIGAGVADFLQAALGKDVVETFVFTAASKSRLGYDFLSAVNSGRFKLYAPDGSDDCREFWRQCELAQYSIRANQQINFYVPERDGHDDFLMSAALLAHAAKGYSVAPAGSVVPRAVDYEDGRY